jgi:asparagine synthase (glutamine-hydrolysing)
MCGISGIVCFDGNPARLAPERLAAMGDALVHRGPDGAGTYVDASTPGIALVHRRLSIIDLDGGRQPIANEDDTIQVIFNGEIFNYLELGRELAGRGHQFRTRTDTEVLVHLYEDLGDDFVHRLNGQFAIALWDSRRRRLLLVRDRPGILPLFYYERAGELLFASEIKAILAALPAAPGADADALRDVMTLWAPLTPATLFRGIVEVEPGQMVSVEQGGTKRRTYWTWRLAPEDEVVRPSEADSADELMALLADATRLRLRADVEVGAFLSGGLDSSVLVGLIGREAGRRLRTFSVGFGDPELDEGAYQRLMVDAVGARHSHICCSSRDIGARFHAVIRAAEVPLTRTGPAPIHALAAHVAKSGCKVVLTGEGADEVLGGYDLFKEAKVRAFCARGRTSTWRPRLLTRLYPSFNTTRTPPSALIAAYFGALDGNPTDPGFSHEMRWAAGPAVETLLSKEFLARCDTQSPAERALDRFAPALEGRSLLQRGQFLEARTLMPGYLLNSQCDRMLMAHSVEGRFPYLDHRVVEFANRLHPQLKMRALREKVLLKQAARGLVPDAIIRRPKQPYRGPDARVFFGLDQPPYVQDLLSPHTINAWGYFDPARVAHLTERIETAARTRRPISHRDSLAFLTVLSTQIWHAHFQTRQGESSWQ